MGTVTGVDNAYLAATGHLGEETGQLSAHLFNKMN